MSRLYLLLMFVTYFSITWSQEEKGLVRSGNKQYENKKYSDAELNYRKAIEKQPGLGIANYNLGNALYRQDKFQEAAEQFGKAADGGLDKKDLAKNYHNLGNSMLQAQKYQEGVDAYKKALKYNPNDIDTKYNLAYAQRMLKNKPPENKDNKDDKNKDNKDNKDKQNKDKQDKDKQDKQDNKQDQNKENQDKQQQQQPQAGKISKDDAKRMLQAIQNDENNTQDKLKKEKAQAQKVRTEVDW